MGNGGYPLPIHRFIRPTTFYLPMTHYQGPMRHCAVMRFPENGLTPGVGQRG
jgi:hypothetical protein